MEDDCVFCGIIGEKKPASVVYSDDKVIAFLVIRPINPGHLIVIPKTHASGLSDLDEETGAHMFKIALRIVKALKKSEIKCEGINLFLSDGRAASQEIFHVHLHVVPRFVGDEFGIKYGPDNFLELPRDELDKIAAVIRNALEKQSLIPTESVIISFQEVGNDSPVHQGILLLTDFSEIEYTTLIKPIIVTDYTTMLFFEDKARALDFFNNNS